MGKSIIILILIDLVLIYSGSRFIFCFAKILLPIFKEKKLKKFLWGDLVFGIIYLFLCIKLLGKDFFSQNQGLHSIVCIIVVLLFMLMKKKNNKLFSYSAFVLIIIDLLGVIFFGGMKFYGILVIQIPIWIASNFIEDNNRLNKYTYSALMMTNLLNVGLLGSIFFTLFEQAK